ncbi:MAG: hypothetical protein ACJ75B_00040 [Flavisolibacter sp.]
MKTKGKWVTAEDNIVGPEKSFPKSQYQQVLKRIDKIAALFQQAYPEPVGMQAKWYRAIRGSSLVENGPVPYQFNSLYEAWYCNPNLHKLMIGSETGTWAYVHANSFGWLISDQSDKLWITIGGQTAYLLAKKIGEWKGLALYEPSSNRGKCKAVLFTRKNQLPYAAVNRLQFLQAMKENLEADKKRELDAQGKMPVRSDAEEEQVKQKRADAYIKSFRPERQAQARINYMKDYKTDQMRKNEMLQQTAAYFDAKIKAIDHAWIGLDEKGLEQPAIVTEDYHELFKGFSTEEKGGRMIVVLNKNYFDLKLPKYAPQFLVLYWEWDGNRAAQNFKKHLEENFPVEQMQALIDK